MRRLLLTGLTAFAVHGAFSQGLPVSHVPVAPAVRMPEKWVIAPIDLLYMPAPYAYEHLGLFCKAEVKMNRFLPMPLMFRLGDVEHAQELEGKGVLHGLRNAPEP